MSVFESPNSGAAALVFLILYTVYTVAVIVIVTRLGWKTVYSLLLYYGIVRFGSQLCGVVYSAIGVEHWQWLIAYLILGAQGYFALILAAFRFIIKGQREKFGHSWLDPSKDKKLQMINLQNNVLYRFYGRFTPWKIIRYTMIASNILIIYGGSSVAGKTIEELNADPSTRNTARICRTVGQAMFLCLTLSVIGLSYYSYFVEKITDNYHIQAVMFSAGFLIVRGIFGLLSIYVSAMDYYAFNNYSQNGLKPKFVIAEYVMGTTMEFIVGSLFIAAYYYTNYKQSYNVEQKDLESDAENQNLVK